MEIVPIRVKIGLKSSGPGALYPDFGTLASVIASGLDWSVYVDNNGSGWLYDKCGHREEEPGSPFGIQFGVLLVPDVFATEAAAAFPSEVTIITEAQLENFYNTKHAKDFEDEEIKLPIVDRVRAKQALGQTLTQRQLRSIDPSDNTPGIRLNIRKRWVDFKSLTGFTIKP